MTQSYFQLGLKPEHIPLTKFIFKTKSYAMTRCGQGQRNSPVFLNKLMALILKDMPHKSACNFADDIVIATETISQHYLYIILILFIYVIEINHKDKYFSR